MKNNMEEIDLIIKDTLTQEEAKFYDELEEQGLFGKIGNLFKTKYSWLIILMNIVSIIVLGCLVYSVIKFFSTEITNELIKWGAGIFIAMMFMSMIKLFVWLQMDKNDILRELKRVELQVAALAGKK